MGSRKEKKVHLVTTPHTTNINMILYTEPEICDLMLNIDCSVDAIEIFHYMMSALGHYNPEFHKEVMKEINEIIRIYNL